ncbi:MAG: hypothetical protein ACK5KT_15105 [Dysgonomonas sp.]
MSTNILNVSVPDAPTPSMEMCHEFTFNYLVQRRYNQTSIAPVRYMHSGGAHIYRGLYALLLDSNKQHFNPGLVPIIAGDILIFSTDRNNILTENTVVHSMVALSAITWYGVNNAGIFGPIYNQNRLRGPELSPKISQLRDRGKIDNIDTLFYNFELLNQVNALTQHRVQVYRQGRFTTNNPNFVSHLRTPNVLPYIQYFIHIFR